MDTSFIYQNIVHFEICLFTLLWLQQNINKSHCNNVQLLLQPVYIANKKISYIFKFYECILQGFSRFLVFDDFTTETVFMLHGTYAVNCFQIQYLKVIMFYI